MRVGVFGGEFDPPHLGHLAVVRTARDQLGLDRVLVIPAARPPHRRESRTPAEDRLRMAELTFAGEPQVEVSRAELDREGPSYTVDTLRLLAGADELVLIVGADQDIRDWHEPDEILRLAQLAVAPRGGDAIGGGDVTELEMEPVDLSSTRVREAIAAGGGTDAVVPAVLELIRSHGLYGGAPC
ncbi:MAG: nicotinate-nucleotide adenylyltransferase [Gaiellales bacterium]|jgi:nicotinate-nucleotide adenylyltransferase|nr:nicotinate-nucleotide adenylyltransferase [Gaiellales bacterium]